MHVELIPQVCAVLLTAGGAITDALKGKIYNKWILTGLSAAACWLIFLGVWNSMVGGTEYERFPQLGRWSFSPPVAVEQAPTGPAPWEVPHEVSVFPAPDVKGVEDGGAEGIATPAAPSFWVYLVKVLANTMLAFVAGFILWWFGLWAAGDAKLFGALAFLLPLSTYENAFMSIFPSYVLIFNTFVSVMFILFIEMAGRAVRQAFRPTDDEKTAWRTSLDWIRSHAGELLLGFVGIMFLFICIKTLRMLFRDVLTMYTALDNKPLVFLLLFLVFKPVINAMRRRWISISIVSLTFSGLLYMALYPTDEYNLQTALSMSSVALGIILFYILYSIYLNVFDFRGIKVWELARGMILARRTSEVLKEDEDLLDHKMGPVGPDGMSAEQVEVLRRWWIDRGKGGVIWVSRTIPFAPALFVGTVITVLMGGYIVWT